MSLAAIPGDPGSGPGQAPESRNTKNFWTPAFAGVTSGMIFWKAVESDVLVVPMINVE
jgi:hypothetical protein